MLLKDATVYSNLQITFCRKASGLKQTKEKKKNRRRPHTFYLLVYMADQILSYCKEAKLPGDP